MINRDGAKPSRPVSCRFCDQPSVVLYNDWRLCEKHYEQVKAMYGNGDPEDCGPLTVEKR